MNCACCGLEFKHPQTVRIGADGEDLEPRPEQPVACDLLICGRCGCISILDSEGNCRHSREGDFEKFPTPVLARLESDVFQIRARIALRNMMRAHMIRERIANAQNN